MYLIFIANVSIKHVKRSIICFGILNVKLLSQMQLQIKKESSFAQLAKKQLTNQDNLVIKD
jgi:hypothetical protein